MQKKMHPRYFAVKETTTMKLMRSMPQSRNLFRMAYFVVLFLLAGGLALVLTLNAQKAVANNLAVQTALGTAFTYQGHLNDGSNPANGAYDFRFTLYDAETGGAATGAPVDVSNVNVQQGVFTVNLDFGANAFTGAPRWLAISVRPVGGSFSDLTPRQAISPAPYALYADTAGNVTWANITGMPDGFKDGIDDTGAGHTHVGEEWNAPANGLTITSTATGGFNYSIGAFSNSPDTVAVFGRNHATNINSNKNHFAPGVWGISDASGGRGVEGDALSSNGQGFGVAGFANSPGAIGVYGFNNAANTNINLSNFPRGVYGLSDSSNGIGVQGEAFSSSGQTIGVAGFANSSAGYGIYGNNSGGGKAGYFEGDVQISGKLTKSSGAFKIDHPLDPANKYLYHSFVESPDMMNIYNGNVLLDANGEAVVQMPAWFEALNMEFRYQLTAIGAPGPNLYIAKEMANNQFQIAGGVPNMKVSWQITGIRHDPYAQVHRIPVEEDKPIGEKGTYLAPLEYGQSAARGLNFQAATAKAGSATDKATSVQSSAQQTQPNANK